MSRHGPDGPEPSLHGVNGLFKIHRDIGAELTITRWASRATESYRLDAAP